MMKIQFCYNGDFYKYENMVIDIKNRAFRYGDSLFETILSYGTNIYLLEEHIQRITEGMSVMGMNVPLWFRVDFLRNKIERLLNKNNITKTGRIRLSVFRNEGGLYTPTNNDISYCIEAEKLEHEAFVINKGSYSVDIFEGIQKHPNILSPYKTGNSSIFIMAGIWKNQENLNDCLILNTNGYLCESISSNIFLVKNNTLYTPSVKSGCVNGIMRNFLINICSRNGIKTIESDNLCINDIMNSDELFLTNSIMGLQRVLAFRNKRFYSLFSNKILKLISKEIFES